MARAFGRILSRIWEDPDFLALEPGPQRLYCFLVTQANLNHAGLLPLTLRKWSKKAAGLTPTCVLADLAVLDAARFVVMDEDTEELLVRTLIRNDDIWKMPRVMGSAVSGAMEIESRRLRRALLAEVARIPLHELSDAPTKGQSGRSGPSIRVQIAAHIDALCSAFADLGPEPVPDPPVEPVPDLPAQPPQDEVAEGVLEPLPEGVPEGVPQPLPEGVLEGVVLPPDEGVTEGDTEGVWGNARARGPAHARTSPAPAPTPTPDPLPNPFCASGGGGEPPRHGPALTIVPNGPAATQPPQTADELVGYWIDNVPRRPPGSVIGRVGKSIKTMLAEGIDPADIALGLEAWATRGKDPSVLPSIVNEVMNAGGALHARGTGPGADDLGGDAHMSRYLVRAAARRAREATG